MAYWRESLFATMSRNAGNVADFFRLPSKLRDRAGNPGGALTIAATWSRTG